MRKLEDLNKTELLRLKAEVAIQLKTIELLEKNADLRKHNTKDKTKISQLTTKDTMFGILFTKNDMKIHDVDYCNVEICEKYNDGDYKLNVSHDTKPMGVYNMWVSKERSELPYFCHFSLSSISFFTIRPETWQEDLKESMKHEIDLEKSSFKREVKKIKDSVKAILKDKERINKAI